MNPSLNKTFWLITFIDFIIIVAISYFILRPTVSSIFANYQKVQAAKNELRLIEKERDALMKLQKSKKEIDSLYHKISTFLPKKNNSSDFLVQIETIASQTNQNQTKINLKQTSKEKQAATEEETRKKIVQKSTNETAENSPFKTSTFILEQSGNFLDLIHFLQNLERASQFTTLDSITLTSGENNLLTSQIEGKFYYKPTITIQDSLINLHLSDKEKEQINSLEHFGETISIPSIQEILPGRPDPFIPL